MFGHSFKRVRKTRVRENPKPTKVTLLVDVRKRHSRKLINCNKATFRSRQFVGTSALKITEALNLASFYTSVLPTLQSGSMCVSMEKTLFHAF